MLKKVLRLQKSVSRAALEQSEIDNSDGAELSSFEGESYYANSNGLSRKVKK